MTDVRETKVVIVVFDALRPEFVRPDLMPNLCRFAGQGARYGNSRSTFPTETRVNQSAVLTGCYPRKHGIAGNKFPDPTIAPGAVLNTGIDAEIAQAFAKAPGGLIQRPTMGEHLATQGKTFATLSAGTPGGGRLINHTAEKNGNLRFAMKCPEGAHPAGLYEKLTQKIGPLPEYALPAMDWISWAVDAYLEYIVPEAGPDVMLLWLCEPDESFHFIGIGADGALAAIGNADEQFGRLLDHRSEEIGQGKLQIIAMSDHGQISLRGEPLDLVSLMCDAGFPAGKTPDPENQFTIVAGNSGGIWVRDSDPTLIGKAVDWLMQQHWCGPLFTRRGEGGTLTSTELCTDHARAPDISLVFRYDDVPNDWGIAGSTAHDAPYPVGGGCHGGLSPYELNNVLILGGSRFKPGAVLSQPAGNIDIFPTVCQLLGTAGPDAMDGRALAGAMNGEPEEAPGKVCERILTAANGQTKLSVTELRTQRYLNRAWAP